MKYSVIILNLTIMMGSVMLKRPSPFIFLKNTRSTASRPRLPIDGWLNPFNEINDYDFILLCEETPTAQIIKYNFQIVDTEPRNLTLDGINGDIVTMVINRKKEAVFVIGRKCENENKSQTIFVTKNSNYEGLLIFKLSLNENNKRTSIDFIGIIMNYLSYEDAGKLAIDLFKSSEIIKEDCHSRQLEKVRICASLFRGLSSTLVEGYTEYFIRIKFAIFLKYIKKEHLICKGHEYSKDTSVPFIKYRIYFVNFNGEETLKIDHEIGRLVVSVTNTIYL